MKCRLPLEAALLSAVVSIAGAANATETPPFEMNLTVLPVELDLHDCRIEVDATGAVEPLLRVTTSPGDGGATPEFEVSDTGNLIRIARLDPAGVDAAMVTVELALDPGQAVLIRGQALSISIRRPISPSLESLPPKSDTDEAGLRLQITPVAHTFDLLDSEVYLIGTPMATITGVNTVVEGEDGQGDVTVDIQRGSLSLRRHRGSLHLKSLDSASSVVALVGTVDLMLDGGDLELSDGSGSVTGHVEGGRLSLDHWTGTARLTGEEAAIEVRDGSLSQFDLTAESTRLAVARCRGSVTTHLRGGTLTAEALRGTLQATLIDDAHVEVTGHDGPLILAVRDNSTAAISEIKGSVKASVERSELTLTGAEALDLTARGARLSVAGVSRIKTFDAAASEFELDLRDTEGRQYDLVVEYESVATVLLPSPCRVQLRGSVAASNQVDVTGCEFQMQDTGRWRGGSYRGIDGRPVFLFTAVVGEFGSLRVHGGP